MDDHAQKYSLISVLFVYAAKHISFTNTLMIVAGSAWWIFREPNSAVDNATKNELLWNTHWSVSDLCWQSELLQLHAYVHVYLKPVTVIFISRICCIKQLGVILYREGNSNQKTRKSIFGQWVLSEHIIGQLLANYNQFGRKRRRALIVTWLGQPFNSGKWTSHNFLLLVYY